MPSERMQELYYYSWPKKLFSIKLTTSSTDATFFETPHNNQVI